MARSTLDPSPAPASMAVEAEEDAERRAVIAEAAARCFERWGVHRTRMEDIAREAGIARPALYRYYAGKEALLLEVVVRHITDRAAALHKRVKKKGPAGPLILQALLAGVVGGPDRGIAESVLGVDVLHDTARLVAQTDAVFAAMSRYWRPYLDYASDRGELRADVQLDAAVRWLTSIVFCFLTLPEIVPPEHDLPAYLQTFVVNALVTA
ncbi:MAG: TetR/AcrR family transcriptional regulator [Acidimicrobiia bacterium]